MRVFVKDASMAWAVENAVVGAMEGVDDLAKHDAMHDKGEEGACVVVVFSPGDPLHEVVRAVMQTRKPKAKAS